VPVFGVEERRPSGQRASKRAKREKVTPYEGHPRARGRAASPLPAQRILPCPRPTRPANGAAAIRDRAAGNQAAIEPDERQPTIRFMNRSPAGAFHALG